MQHDDETPAPPASRTKPWSRRLFLAATAALGGSAALAGGLGAFASANEGLTISMLGRAARMNFDRGRARPGFRAVLNLHLPGVADLLNEIDVVLVRSSTVLDSPIAASVLDVINVPLHGGRAEHVLDVPMVQMTDAERANEGYMLTAWLLNGEREPLLSSRPLEVVISPFPRGM